MQKLEFQDYDSVLRVHVPCRHHSATPSGEMKPRDYLPIGDFSVYPKRPLDWKTEVSLRWSTWRLRLRPRVRGVAPCEVSSCEKEMDTENSPNTNKS